MSQSKNGKGLALLSALFSIVLIALFWTVLEIGEPTVGIAVTLFLGAMVVLNLWRVFGRQKSAQSGDEQANR